MNIVCLVGRLTKDPEVKTTTGGKAVATFTVAVNRTYKTNDHPEADFIPCVAWGKTAEVAGKYLQKGNKTGITGRMQVRSYDAQDGSKRYVTEVIVDQITFLEKKQDSDGAGQFGQGVPDEEIPF